MLGHRVAVSYGILFLKGLIIMNPKEYLSAHKGKIVRIGCCSAGAIVMYVVLGKAIRPRRKDYIVTDSTIRD